MKVKSIEGEIVNISKDGEQKFQLPMFCSCLLVEQSEDVRLAYFAVLFDIRKLIPQVTSVVCTEPESPLQLPKIKKSIDSVPLAQLLEDVLQKYSSIAHQFASRCLSGELANFKSQTIELANKMNPSPDIVLAVRALLDWRRLLEKATVFLRFRGSREATLPLSAIEVQLTTLIAEANRLQQEKAVENRLLHYYYLCEASVLIHIEILSVDWLIQETELEIEQVHAAIAAEKQKGAGILAALDSQLEEISRLEETRT